MISSDTAVAGIFGRAPILIGMVHSRALPGTPRHHLPIASIVSEAVREARLLEDAGFDAILLENMHDVPYLRREVGPEIVASLTRIAAAVCDAVEIPVGIQVLAGANRAALAVAQATGARFIRAEGFIFASVADEGILDEADAGPLLRYRRMIGAGQVRIFCDIKKKHSAHAITADIDIGATAKAAEFFGADGVIVTGMTTGDPLALSDLADARAAVRLPVLAGSGVRSEDLARLFEQADGAIVGSALKATGMWDGPLNAELARKMVVARDACR